MLVVLRKSSILKNEVELDETYVGGKQSGKRGRGAEGKSVVFGAVERKGNVNGYVVPNAKAKTLLPIIAETVDQTAHIYTDEFRSYRRLTSNNFNHDTVQHGIREFARGGVHTNNIEGFWSQLKRGVLGTHVWVSEQHLQKYVDEFAFRYNQRSTEIPMFDRLLLNLVRLS
jgi:transposase-like protein